MRLKKHSCVSSSPARLLPPPKPKHRQPIAVTRPATSCVAYPFELRMGQIPVRHEFCHRRALSRDLEAARYSSDRPWKYDAADPETGRLPLNCGWCCGGFKATPPAAMLCLAPLLATGASHKTAGAYRFDRFARGHVIDERGAGAQPNLH